MNTFIFAHGAEIIRKKGRKLKKKKNIRIIII